MIKRGGHSGHVAALGDRFLVAYGEGWVQGAGWRGLGTGQRVFARVVGDTGRLGREVALTPPWAADPRDGWPLVAASDRNWLVVWQRYPELTLQAALIDAAGPLVTRRRIIDGLPPRYACDVAFAPPLGSFVVAGSTGEGGFAALVSPTGKIVTIRRGTPADGEREPHHRGPRRVAPGRHLSDRPSTPVGLLGHRRGRCGAASGAVRHAHDDRTPAESDRSPAMTPPRAIRAPCRPGSARARPAAPSP
jgi:hypothetical protein